MGGDRGEEEGRCRGRKGLSGETNWKERQAGEEAEVNEGRAALVSSSSSGEVFQDRQREDGGET